MLPHVVLVAHELFPHDFKNTFQIFVLVTWM